MGGKAVFGFAPDLLGGFAVSVSGNEGPVGGDEEGEALKTGKGGFSAKVFGDVAAPQKVEHNACAVKDPAVL